MTIPPIRTTRNRWIALAAAGFLLMAAVYCLSRAVDRGLSHDEHQFVAPAVLLAREHLLPYRDVALFHQPYLIFIYAAVGGWTEHPLLMARLVSGCAAVATAGLLFFLGWHRLGPTAGWRRFLLPACILFLWLTAPLFLESSGRTWNHDLPTLFALAAVATIIAPRTDSIPLWRWLIVGLLGGLAVGSRITFAPFALALAGVPLLWPGWSWRTRLSASVVCALGVLVALSPSLWLLSKDKEAYVFGNFIFPRLPLLDADNSRILKTMTPWRKGRFFLKEILAVNWPLALAFFGIALPGLWNRWKTQKNFPDLLPILLTVPILAGCFAPSRYELQHFYAVIPFVVLGIMWALPSLRLRSAIWILAGLCGISAWQNRGGFETTGNLLEPKEWAVSTLHRYGTELREKIDKDHRNTNNDVLTLAPIIPLEGGLQIYPGLATGPFGNRYAGLVEPALRARLGLFSSKDLDMAMKANPPEAILTGYEKSPLENEIIAYATHHGFHPQPFEGKATLWLPGQ